MLAEDYLCSHPATQHAQAHAGWFQTNEAYGFSLCPNQEPTADIGSFVGDLETTTHGTDHIHVEIHQNMGDNLIDDLKGLETKVSKENAIIGGPTTSDEPHMIPRPHGHWPV